MRWNFREQNAVNHFCIPRVEGAEGGAVALACRKHERGVATRLGEGRVSHRSTVSDCDARVNLGSWLGRSRSGDHFVLQDGRGPDGMLTVDAERFSWSEESACLQRQKQIPY